MASESKTAEFARLLNFFERLASYKSRSHTRINDDNDANIDEMDSVPLPADLVPVVNSLANLVNNRIHNTDDAHPHKTTGRKRSHTIATTSHNPRDIDPDDESVAKFPLGKKYTFTFRLMLHKLYQIEDWKQKVKEVLERSQKEYKPLSETIAAAEAKRRTEGGKEERKQDRLIHSKAGTPVGSRKLDVRPRANSALALGRIKESRSTIMHLKSPKSPTMVFNSYPLAEEDVRALKKRCVGRRRSLSGPLPTDGGRIGGNWIYDAEVSAVEIAKRKEAPKYQELELECSPRQPGNAVFGVARPGKAGKKRRVSLTTLGADVEPKKFDDGLIKRRASSVMYNVTPVPVLSKRPLEP